MRTLPSSASLPPHRRRVAPPSLALALALLLAAACGGGGDGPTGNGNGNGNGNPPPPNTVRVVNNQFSPQTITVAPNVAVRWEWAASAIQHNIIPIAPATIPSVPAPRDGPSTYEATFTAAGTYDYYCSVHGTPTSGMRGSVVVQ